MPDTPDYVERNNQAAARYAMQQQLPSYNFNNPINPYNATSGGWYGPPVAGGPQMLPAVQASGAHYSAPGSREGWIEQGVPPVIYQRSPYATAAFRVTPNPWGGASVAPLVGFPSRYPHVVSGVPMQPGSLAMSVAAPYIMRPPAPARRPAAPARRPAGNGNKQNNQQNNQQQNQNQQTTTDPVRQPPADTRLVGPYTGIGGVSATGFDPYGNGPAPQMRNDADLTASTANTRSGTFAGGATSIDALNDIMNRYHVTGQGAVWQPTIRQGMTPGQQAADNTGIGATRLAERQGLDRSAYWRDLQERTRAAEQARYEDLVRQQRGY